MSDTAHIELKVNESKTLSSGRAAPAAAAASDAAPDTAPGMEECDVAVIGAGPGGLATALALQAAGRAGNEYWLDTSALHSLVPKRQHTPPRRHGPEHCKVSAVYFSAPLSGRPRRPRPPPRAAPLTHTTPALPRP